MTVLEGLPILQTPHMQATNPIPSSSPAFAAPPVHVRKLDVPRLDPPSKPDCLNTTQERPITVLPILLPPTTLRPIAFRTLTKKHNLTLTSQALQALASFIGKHCGARWREDGLAELVLEEVARAWKRTEANVIIDVNGNELQSILKQLDGCMKSGRIISGSGRSPTVQNNSNGQENETIAQTLPRQESFGMSNLEVEKEEEETKGSHLRQWLKVVDAFEQPRLLYNASRKHFEKSKLPSTFFPSPSHKTELLRQRYHIIHQRVLRNESFQTSSIAVSTRQQWKITPIANLLGRSGSGHLILGLLTVAPAGTLAISDLTGGIHLDLSQAVPIDEIATWLCPGMVVLVDGIYEEDFNSAGGSLGNMGGIGGMIGGRFVGFSIGGPKCETRATTLGLTSKAGLLSNVNVGGGFGWVDFLGLGSERAIGTRMRRIEERLLHSKHTEETNTSKIVILGSCTLDDPKTLYSIRQILSSYSIDITETSTTSPPPLAFVLLGSFVSTPAMSVSPASTTALSASSIPDSIAYKEAFDALASLLADYPTLLRSSTWIFVPGDADPWPSAFSAGSAVPIPRQPVPDLFTSRIRRSFATANAGARGKESKVSGEAIWTSNPSRISLFGPSCELVLFRDNVSGRMRRNHIPLNRREEQGQTIADEHPLAAAVVSGIESSLAEDKTVSMNVEHAHPMTQHLTAAKEAQVTPAHTLTKTLLDQSHLSPFLLGIRPQHWDFATSALSLYPLPTALLLCDTEVDPFVLGYQGCTVVNCGAVAGGTGGTRATWCEYDIAERQALVRSIG